MMKLSEEASVEHLLDADETESEIRAVEIGLKNAFIVFAVGVGIPTSGFTVLISI